MCSLRSIITDTHRDYLQVGLERNLDYYLVLLQFQCLEASDLAQVLFSSPCGFGRAGALEHLAGLPFTYATVFATIVFTDYLLQSGLPSNKVMHSRDTSWSYRTSSRPFDPVPTHGLRHTICECILTMPLIAADHIALVSSGQPYSFRLGNIR